MRRAQGTRREPPAGWSAAVRALACKWIRIIFRRWQTLTTYSEETYLQQLHKTISPILKFLDQPKPQPQPT